MGILDFSLIGLALALDSFAISLTNGAIQKRFKFGSILSMAFLFAFFHGVMSFCGYLGGTVFKSTIQPFNHIIALLVLGVLGVKMIMEGVKADENEAKNTNHLRV